MTLPVALRGRLAIPAIAAPVGPIPAPDFVIETCRGGVLGTLRALDHRTSSGFEESLSHIQLKLEPDAAPFAVNLIVHATNPRFADDFAICVEHRVPVILTARGVPTELAKRVRGYGGIVFHEVTSVRQAKAAALTGVDGLVVAPARVDAGPEAASPFALMPEIRRFFAGTIVMASCIADGQGIAAARMLGADLASIGTRCDAAGDGPGAPARSARELCRRLAAEYEQAVTAFRAAVTDLARPSMAL